MKKMMKFALLVAATVMLLPGCNCFKKMAKNGEDVSIQCTPEVLVLNNGVVAADVTATFPVKYFNAKAVLKVTPVIVFEGGEVAAAPFFLQGSKVDDNYTVVDKKQGGVITRHIEFPYDERMRASELQLRLEVKCPSGKCKEFTLVNANTGELVKAEEIAANPAIVRECGMVIAEGINTLQEDLCYADAMAPLANNYKRVTTTVEQTEILYTINSSSTSRRSLKDAGLEDFKANVEETLNNDRATQHIAVKGYASPDGPETFNDRLSQARSTSGQKAVAKLLKETGLEVDAAAYGEDWEGFQELVANSDIEDKELILQVLGMYTSSTQREAEIKNMASVFGELKSEVLPKLRRSMVVNTTDLEGKTDAEMMFLVESGKLGDLNLEELLFVAESVAEEDATKIALLEYAANNYNDARAYNNLGILYAENGCDAEALKAFEKAAELGEASMELNNNLALANLAVGKVEEAKKYANGATAEAKSLVAAAQGNYAEAVQELEGYNAAVAQTLNENYAEAKRAIANDTTAAADYLRAVIASQEGDLRTAEAQLKSAVEKDPSLVAKAKTDVHFRSLFANGLAF